MSNKTVYLDYHATTPCDPRVVEAMIPFYTEHFGNIASSHSFAKIPKDAVQKARKDAAALIGAHAEELCFTSGATESNNLAIKGYALANQHRAKHLITTPIEHKSVIDTMHQLQDMHGFDVDYVKVDRLGRIDIEHLKELIRVGNTPKERTSLLSVIAANNEIGTIQDIKTIGDICEKRGIAFHVDAVQAVAKIPVNVKEWKVNFLSLSAHKMYGPKGIGALYVNLKNDCPKLEPLLCGGGQEMGLRSGTLAVPLVVGFGKSCELAYESIEDQMRQKSLLEDFQVYLKEVAPDLRWSINGDQSNKLAGNLSMTFENLDGEFLAFALKDFAVSSTSACSAASGGVSHVLTSIGLSKDEASRTLRFGVGKYTKKEDLVLAARTLSKLCEKFAS